MLLTGPTTDLILDPGTMPLVDPNIVPNSMTFSVGPMDT